MHILWRDERWLAGGRPNLREEPKKRRQLLFGRDVIGVEVKLDLALHEDKPGRVTISGKPSDDLAPCTLDSILKQAGLKR